MKRYFIPYPNTETESRWTEDFLKDCRAQGGRMEVLHDAGDGIHYRVERKWLKGEYSHWDISLYSYMSKTGNPRGYFITEDDITISGDLFKVE